MFRAISILSCDHPGCEVQFTRASATLYDTRTSASNAGWKTTWGTNLKRRGEDLCPDHKETKDA